MEYFEMLQYRRSTRAFTGEPVSQADLEQILLAANSAPVGSNMYRDIHLTVVEDREVLDRLSEAALERRKDKAKVKKLAGETRGVDFDQKDFDPFYGAPLVIFVSHRRQDLQPGIEYSNAGIVDLAMHLAATDLGLGSVLMWYALESMRELPELDNTALLGLPEGFEPLIGIAIGHPAKELEPRKPDAGRIGVNYLR